MKLKLLHPRFRCFLYFVLLCITKTATATHVQGGDLTYTCLGGNQYQVRLALYRDCAGVSAPNSATVNYKSASCNVNLTVTLNKVPGTGVEVTPICSSLVTQCAGGTFPGVQEYIYTGIVTLPPCSDWVLSYNLNARNNAINTIVNPGGQNMYIEATLNNLAFPCNDSPTFTNRPVPFICVGQPFCFNNGSKDTDGDSLSYTLETPMNNPGSYVTYIAPYTANQPLTSSPAATFNPLTGDMCVTPSSIQVTVFAVVVKEWRNGILVGSVTRDIQVRTITCSNNNPYLNGINNTGAYTISACAGTPLTFNVPSFDADVPQNITLTWNAGITGATFNPGTGTRPTGTFSWTPTLADISNTSHCFTVKVTDNNCPFNGSQTYSFCINVGGITTTTSSTNATCTSPNGSATINVSGGVAPITYNWVPSVSSTSTATNLTAGSYTYTVTDAFGCDKTGVIVVGSNPGGTVGINTFKNVSCFNLSDGAITISTGGSFTAPYIYTWSPSAGSTNSISNLSAGIYSVTVTDANGCSASATQTITQPPVLTVNPTYTNVGCNGGSSGTATGSVTGGTGPYSYLWLPGAFSTSSITSLPIGTYSLSVTDSKGCTTAGSVTITQPPALSITSSTTSANCGQSNGTATVSGSGGFAPYTWTWSNGQTGVNATGLTSGTYIVTITDINLCSKNAAVTIGNIAGPTATISSFNNISCNGGNDGNATISVSGGTPPFTYLWSNGQITPTASNLGPGIYSVNAKDAAGCIATTTITITQPTLLVANAIKTDPACFGNATGTVLASAIGGTLPYSFVWTTPGSPTTSSVTGLSAGTYNVTITDGKGCIKTKSVTLINPPAVTASSTVTPVSCNGTCNGTATATISNGTAPFTYIWNSPVNQFNATATNLCAGSYTVSVTDVNGCTAKAVATITQPTLLTSTISSTGNLTCYGVCIGFAQVNPSGGTVPYTYSWMPGGITTALAKNLCAGSYTCTVTDAKGCNSTSVATITQPPQLKATVTGTNINCFGTCDGTGNISFSGGVPPYNFLWTPSLQTIYNPANLCTGVNTANITDANGCSATGSVTLTEAYTALTITSAPVNSNCGQANGSVCATVSGGLAPYTYIWNDSAVTQLSCANSLRAGTYSVDVKDANGCVKTHVANINDISGPTVNITSHTDLLCFGLKNATANVNITGGVLPYSIVWTPGGQTTANPTDLAAGVNTITVKDNAGCSASKSVTILEPPAIVHAISSTTNVSCFNLCNGSAKIIASGGTGSLTYLWNDPSLQTTTTASNLCAGKYKVTIKDANACITTDSVIITKPTPLIIINSTVKNITCFGDNDGVISTTSSGGTPFYTYSWTPNISISPFANALTPGSYSLTVTDFNGCTAIENWTISQPLALTDTTGFSATTCSKANGKALITPFGGTSPYTYQWNDPALQTISSIGNLFSGNYTVLVTDAHGCKISENYIIPDKAGPTIDSVNSTPVLCFGGATGIAKVFPTANTGTLPLTYLWNPGTQTLPTASGLSKGVYNVIVSDANGCNATGTVIVTEPPLLELFVSPTDTICYGNTVQIYGQASGGVPAYTYTWLGAGTGLTGTGPHLLTPTSTVTYSLTVNDSKGCSVGPKNILVVVRPQLTVTSSNISICDGASGTITATPSGGTGGPYTYNWSNGSNTQSQTVTTSLISSPATYTVTVSDGCSNNATGIAIVTVNPKSVGVLIASDTSGCQPLTVTFTAASNNGVNYTWNFGDSGTGIGSPVVHTYYTPGSYTVTMTINTSAGCTTQVTGNNHVTVHPLPVADFINNPTYATVISPTIQFFDKSTPVTKWQWSFRDPYSPGKDSSTLQNPTHSFSSTGSYKVRLIVTNQFGCMDTVIRTIEVKDDFVFYAPNAFTPNGDLNNEIFLPKGIGWDVDTFKMMIFDRWGNLIYQTEDYKKGWDGRANGGSDIAQIDVYVWKVFLKDFSGKEHKYIGHVSIVK